MSINVGSKSFSVVQSSRLLQITAQGMEKPERRVRRVIKPFLLAIREHVRNQSVPDIIREGSQDISGLEGTAGDERKAFEADHGVASPIGEPMVSRDDGANFIAGRVGARRFFKSAARGDDKLVRRKNQFCRNAAARFRNRVSARDARAARVPRQAQLPVRALR